MPERTFSLHADFFSVDNLGNIYTVKEAELKKFDAQGRLLNTYSNKLLGRISFIDVGNPMMPLLFYKNLSQIIFLDNTLSAHGEPLALESLGMELASLVCSSVNNSFWAYDQRNFQLIRFDRNLKKLAETGNILLQAGGELQPNFLMEKNNRVYLNDPVRGILVFDIFGTYIKTIPLKNLPGFQMMEDVLFFVENQKVVGFSLSRLTQKEILLPVEDFRQVITDGRRIYFLTENELKIYSIRLK